MYNITSQAKSLLARQQQQQQQHPTILSGSMTTIRPELQDMNELIHNVYTNIPQEFQRFLELSQDFIHMGSHMLASAYVLKVNQFMEEAKGAIVQNMSVAGSQASYDSRSNVVGPWMARNGTFHNRTSAPSIVGSSLSAFKRPLPPTNRKHLRPIQENLPPHPQVARAKSQHAFPLSSDEENFVRNRIVRSTPIRPDVHRPRSRSKYRDNEIFGENLSPLQAEKKSTCRKLPPPTSRPPRPTSRHPGRSEPVDEDEEEEEDLLTRNSPSTRSNSKKRNESPEVVRKNPIAEKKKRPVPPTPVTNQSDTLNSTVTRLGRVVKPPRKFTTGQDNSIMEDIRDAKQHQKVAAPQTKRQPERAAENQQPPGSSTQRVAVNKEKVTKKRTPQELSSPVREDRAPVQKIKKKVLREDNRAPEEVEGSRKRAPVRQDREIPGNVSVRGAGKEERAEASRTIKKSECKENNKRPQMAKADSTVTKRRKLLPTVEDDIETSLRKLLVQALAQRKETYTAAFKIIADSVLNADECSTSCSKSEATSRNNLHLGAQHVKANESRNNSIARPANLPAGEAKTSGSKRVPSTTRKQPAATKRSTAELPPPSPVTPKKANVVKKPDGAIKLSLGGTPQIDFDISQRSFLSCEESSEDEM